MQAGPPPVSPLLAPSEHHGTCAESVGDASKAEGRPGFSRGKIQLVDYETGNAGGGKAHAVFYFSLIVKKMKQMGCP